MGSDKGSIPSERRASAFIAFQSDDFRWLWMGQLISTIGTQMQLVAINWHVYILTNSPMALGLIGLARVIPSLTLSLLGGAYADARDRRKILLLTQFIMMVLAGLFVLLNGVKEISVVLIYLLAAAISATEAFNNPAWQAIIPNLVPREHLMNALSLNAVMRKTATIVGPALAGFAIAWKGVTAVYLINMVSFIAVLIPLLRMKTPTQKSLGGANVSLSAVNEGIHFVYRNRILLSMALLDFVSVFFSSATSLLPIFAKEILKVGPQGLGILHAGQSVGSVIAGGVFSWLGDVRKKGRFIFYGVTLYAAATVIFGGSHWFVLSFLALVLVGAGDTISAILRDNLKQMLTPDQLRGRVNSVVRLFTFGSHQLGDFEAGLVAALIGAPLSVVTGGIVNLLFIGAMIWKGPKLQDFES